MKIFEYDGNSIHLRITKKLDILFKGKGIPKHYHISEITPEIVGNYEAYVELLREVDNAQYSLHSPSFK